MRVCLKYTFIFNPNESWRSNLDFSNDLLSYFKGMGLDADVIDTKQDSDDDTMILLEKSSDVLPEPIVPKTTKVSLPMPISRGWDGRYKKLNA